MNLNKFLLPLLLLVTIFVYYPGLSGPFVADDLDQISENQKIQSGSSLHEIVYNGHRQKRIVQNLSFALDWKLWDGDPWGFKVTNLVLQILCAIILFLWLRLLFPLHPLIAPLSTALFLLHPLQVESVTYIMGRVSILQSLWVLLSLYIVQLKGRVAWPLLLPVFFMAFATKETGALVPFIVLVYMILVMGKPLRYAFSKDGIILLALPILYAPFMIFFKEQLSMYKNTVGFNMYPMGQYVVGQLYHFSLYLRGFFDSSIQSIHHPLPLISTTVILGAVFAGLVLIAIAFLCYKFHKSHPKLVFMVFLAAMSMAVTNTAFQMINPFAEYRLHSANISLFVLVSFFASTWLKSKNTKVQATLIGIFLVFLAAQTWSYNKVWGDGYSIYSRAAELYPKDFQTQMLMGNAYELQKLYSKAEIYYKKAVTLNESSSRRTAKPIFRLAYVQTVQEKWSDALESLNMIPVEALSAGAPAMYFQLRLKLTDELNDTNDFNQTLDRAIELYGKEAFSSYERKK